EQILAGLLRDHLGARGADVASEAAEARRARNPPPRPANEQTAQTTPSSTWEPPKEEDDERPIFTEDRTPQRIADDGQRDFVELFVNVGRRERLRPADLQQLLEEKGVSAQEMGRIRMRDRVTYISVRKGTFARAVAALAGQVIGGRTVVAELARGRA